MQSLKVSEEIHDLIKRYCVLNRCKIEDFVDTTFKNNEKLNSFKKEIQRLKFH